MSEALHSLLAQAAAQARALAETLDRAALIEEDRADGALIDAIMASPEGEIASDEEVAAVLGTPKAA